MNKLLLTLLLLSPISYADDVSQYICTIKGIYTNNDGLLIPRDEEKGIGEKLYINTDTAEVTGYFSTDGWAITKYKRPKGLMSIETASGLIGDGVNSLTVSPVSKSDNKYTFFVTTHPIGLIFFYSQSHLNSDQWINAFVRHRLQVT